MLLLKVHLPLWVVGSQVEVEDELDVGARTGECDFCVTLATPVLEADLSLLLWTISVACVTDLQKRNKESWWLIYD